jgi:hypothetical protein
MLSDTIRSLGYQWSHATGPADRCLYD